MSFGTKGCMYCEGECNKECLSQEEPKRETLEEAAEKEFPLLDTEWCRTGAAEEENLQLLGHRKSFIKGASWQAERMHSHAEVLAILEQFIEHPTKPGYKRTDVVAFIKEFKKK